MLENYKIPSLSVFPFIGSEIHVSSAVYLVIILWLRLYYIRKSGRETIDTIEPVEGNGAINFH
jgi:hypothetical protein